MSGAKNSYAGKVKPRKPNAEQIEHRSNHDDLGILRQKLTDKQRTFVYEYVVNQVSGTEAARRAGYKHPNVRAAELLHDKPYVADRISHLRKPRRTTGQTARRSPAERGVFRSRKRRESAWSSGWSLRRP